MEKNSTRSVSKFKPKFEEARDWSGPGGSSERGLDDELKEIDRLLRAWGQWVRDVGANVPPNAPKPESLLGRVIREGFGALQSSGYDGCIPVEIAAVDAAVSRVTTTLQRVVRVQYLYGGGWPIEDRAKRIGVTVRRYNQLLRIVRETFRALLMDMGLPEQARETDNRD